MQEKALIKLRQIKAQSGLWREKIAGRWRGVGIEKARQLLIALLVFVLLLSFMPRAVDKSAAKTAETDSIETAINSGAAEENMAQIDQTTAENNEDNPLLAQKQDLILAPGLQLPLREFVDEGGIAATIFLDDEMQREFAEEVAFNHPAYQHYEKVEILTKSEVVAKICSEFDREGAVLVSRCVEESGRISVTVLGPAGFESIVETAFEKAMESVSQWCGESMMYVNLDYQSQSDLSFGGLVHKGDELFGQYGTRLFAVDDTFFSTAKIASISEEKISVRIADESPELVLTN